MNKEALYILGAIVYGVAQKSTQVRVSMADSVITSGLFTIKATRVRGGKTTEVTEMVSEEILNRVSDPGVIVDVLVKKLNATN